MPTFKVKTENGVIEVDQSAITLPDGFQLLGENDIPDGFVKQEVMDSTIADRVKKAKTNALQEAHANESVRNQVLSEYGVELDENGKPKGLDSKGIDLEKEREKWEKQNLVPIKTELEEAKGKLTNLQSTTIKQSLRSAFAGKAKDEYLDADIGDPYVEQVFGSKFKYNPEVGKVLQVDSEGNFEMHPNGKTANGHGYIEPDDFIQINADSKLMKRILKDDTQSGSGFQKGGGGGDGKVTRKQFDQMDPQAQSKAISNGVQVVD